MNVSNTVNLPPSGYEYCVNGRSRPFFQSNPFAFNIYMSNGNIALKEGQAYRVVLRNIQFQNLIPNINSYNNSFSFIFNGTTYTFILAISNYTVTSFLTAINTALAGVNAGLQIAYDTNAKLITLFIPASSTFQWNRGTVTTSIVDNRQYLQAPYDRFLALIGFIDNARAGTINTTTTASSIVGTSPLNLYGTSWIDVTLNTQLNCVHMQPLGRQILVRIPVLVDYGQIIRFDPTYAISFTMDYSALGSMQMTCYDEWGSMIKDAPFDTPFQMQLLLIPLNQGND